MFAGKLRNVSVMVTLGEAELSCQEQEVLSG